MSRNRASDELVTENALKKRRRYAYRKENGLCVKCGTKTENGRVVCERCGALNRAWKIRNSITFGGRTSEAKRRKQSRIDSGLCIRCGENDSRPGKRTCVSCMREGAAKENAKNPKPKKISEQSQVPVVHVKSVEIVRLEDPEQIGFRRKKPWWWYFDNNIVPQKEESTVE